MTDRPLRLANCPGAGALGALSSHVGWQGFAQVPQLPYRHSFRWTLRGSRPSHVREKGHIQPRYSAILRSSKPPYLPN